MRHVGTAVVLAILLFGAVPATAQIVQLGNFGFWRVYGGKANEGTPVCGTSVYNNERSRSFHIKHFKGDDYLVVHVFKDTWKIPKGTEIKVSLYIDNLDGWIATGTGHGNMVEWPIRLGNMQKFLNEFSYGMRMRVSFPDGDENDWNVSLTGSQAAMASFSQCMSQLTLGKSDSQPFGGRGSQPFRAPSQPHAPTPAPTPLAPPRT